MGLFRFLFFPIIRAGEQAKSSGKRIKESTDAAKKQLDKLSQHGAVSNPEERFEYLVQSNNWSQEELERQLTAVRRTKYFAMLASMISLGLVVYLMVLVPAYVAILMVPVALFSIALSFVMVLKYTLFQEQLRRRSLISLKVIFSEDALWSHVFK